ncbi:hypothetical protein HK405_007010 [Cladochytrium tenue]|nr:hypothetical protein HK405_007010 [Cladochytrium tenue]
MPTLGRCLAGALWRLRCARPCRATPAALQRRRREGLASAAGNGEPAHPDEHGGGRDAPAGGTACRVPVPATPADPNATARVDAAHDRPFLRAPAAATAAATRAATAAAAAARPALDAASAILPHISASVTDAWSWLSERSGLSQLQLAAILDPATVARSIADAADSLLDRSLDGTFLRRLALHAQDVRAHPELDASTPPARIRVAAALGVAEESILHSEPWRRARARALADFLGVERDSVHPDDVPVIAIAGSGGGDIHALSPALFPNPGFRAPGFVDQLSNEEFISVMDSGMENSIPFAPLLRKERDVDVLIVLDSSSMIGDHPFLRRGQAYAERRGLPYRLPLGTREPCVVFHGLRTPTSPDFATSTDDNAAVAGTAAAMPDAEGRCRTPPAFTAYAPLARNPRFDPSLDPATARFCRSVNLVWTPGQVDAVAGLARHQALELSRPLRDAVRVAWLDRRRRRTERGA